MKIILAIYNAVRDRLEVDKTRARAPRSASGLHFLVDPPCYAPEPKLNPKLTVNYLSKLLSIVAVLIAPAVWAQTAPITLTLQSYQAFTEGFTRVVDAVSPGSAAEALEEMREGLGIQDLKGIDQSRPWQVAVWLDSMSVPPCLSIRVPVSNFAAFRDGLNPGLLKGEDDANRIQQVGNYATVWIEFGSPTESTKAGEKAWKPESLKTAAGVAQLAIRPSAGLREEMVGAVGMGRMAIGAAMTGQNQEAMGGIDPKVMGELMSVYFDVIETGIKGLESLEIKLDLKGDTLIVDETIVPVANSALAGWFTVKDGNLGALSPFLNRKSPMGVAMRFEGNESLMPILKRFIGLSLQLQGLPADSEAIRETERLVEAFVPMQFAGNIDVKQGIQFGGIYQFPGKDSAKVYASMKEFLRNSMQSQVGTDKPYSSVTLDEGQRKVNGVSVDRTTMVMNLEAPIYQMPGQKEMMENLWPGGRMIFDYALKGQDLIMGTPEHLDALLTGPAVSASPPDGVNPQTVAFGHFNVFNFINAVMAANPMMSDEDKAKLRDLDSTGTGVDFRVDLGNRLVYHAGIPLKLLRTMGQLAD